MIRLSMLNLHVCGPHCSKNGAKHEAQIRWSSHPLIWRLSVFALTLL